MPVTVKKSSEKRESQEVLAALKKTHGEGIGSMGDGYAPVGRVSCGVFPLDLAIGGGFPLWRTSMLVGPESSGKTAIAMRLAAAVQRAGRTAVLVDMENSYDPTWAGVMGVDTKSLVLIQPDTGEQAVDACEGMMNADDVGIVVLDSLATMYSQKAIESDPSTMLVAGNSLLVSKLYIKMGNALTKKHKEKKKTMFVVVNQIRHKVGVMFGNPETTPGGFAPRYSTSMMIRFYAKKVMQDKVHSHMPTHLHVQGQVQKWKVPVMGTAFEYDMALVSHEGYKLGAIMDTWKTVSNRLQESEDLKKDGKAWVCLGASFPTLEQMREFYNTDLSFQLKCQKTVLQKANTIAVSKSPK